ncbi:MAG: BamA/TamA family outer membrane protein [Deltaproteobacteria bacterium]|nr:BamA/TamA family outer membrane protein [Deltaproteobacteria bacterium]
MSPSVRLERTTTNSQTTGTAHVPPGGTPPHGALSKRPAVQHMITENTIVTVSAITVSGRIEDKHKHIMATLPVRKGSRWRAAQLLKALDLLKQDLDRLGYYVSVHEKWHGTSIVVKVTLKPIPVVRYVYVRGNWPLFEEEILRHFRYRNGSRLPPPEIRKKEFDRQKKRILKYLQREGYFDGDLEIVVEKTKKRHVVDILILLRPLWKISPLFIWNPYLYRIGKVTAEGNRALSNRAIQRLFTHKLLFYHRPFSIKLFRTDLKRLRKKYQNLGYIEVRIRSDFHPASSLDRKRRRVNIHLVVREGRRYQIRLLGHHGLGKKDLTKFLTIYRQGSCDDYEVAQSVTSLQRAYQKKGYLEARVYVDSQRKSRLDNVMTFHIFEGPRLKIREVLFKGNRFISSARLRKVIKTKPYPLLGYIGLGSGGYVTSVQLAQDIGRIRTYYRSKGYRYARVWASVARHPKTLEHPAAIALTEALGLPRGLKGWIWIQFQVDEGRQVRVVSVKLVVDDPHFRKALLNKISLKKGKPFTESAMAKDLARMKRLCADRGHPYVQVAYEAKPSRDRTGVDMTYRVKLGPVVRFGQIFVKGNLKTSKSTILHELVFKTGQRFSLAKIQRSRRNLASLGVFKSASIGLMGLRSKQKTVHVIVQVSERFNDRGTIEVGVGASTDNLWFVSLMYRNRNLFGWAKQFELTGEYGERIQKARLTFRDPRFIRTHLIFDLTGFVRNEDTARLGPLLTYGLSISVIKRFTERIQLFGRYILKRARHREPLYRTAAAMDEANSVDIYTNTASLGPTIIWDHRDNPLVPRKGFQLTASVLWSSRYLLADLLPAARFIHLRLAAQAFIPLPFGLVIAQGVRYDHGFPLGQTVMLPDTERFYAGGDTTVRGYERDQLFTAVETLPLVPGTKGPLVYRVVPQGGNIRMIYNLEIQFPIWKRSILAGLPIWGAIFFDAGSIVNTFGGKGFVHFITGFKHSMGLALRLVTPVGAISVAYGVPFEPSYGTSRSGRIHFNFGFIF